MAISAETIQIATCVRPTAPTPRILPAIISSGRTAASITSKMREVFSSMMERATFMPYSMITKYIRKKRMPMEIIEERTIGPSLGAENIAKGFHSVMYGFAAIAVFMCAYYLLFGVISTLALAFNLLLLVAVLSMLQATLTLPGIAAVALALGMAMVAQGRLTDGERSLEQAEHTLRAEAEPAAGMRLRYARGLFEIVSGRPEAALGAFQAAERLAALLVTEHTLARRGRSHMLQALVRLGETQRVEQALAEMGEQERDSAEMRNALAALRIAQDDPEAATVALAPVINGSAPLVNAHLWDVQALLLEAIARDALGDIAAARRALERALNLARPESLIFPFLLDRAPGLLERHRRLGTAHAVLISEILSGGHGGADSPPVRGGFRGVAPPGQHSGFEVTTHGGRVGTGIDAVDWARWGTELGAGEILLNSMDADGTTVGFDLELIRAVRDVVTVPVIASGGAGTLAHFAPAVDAGADAVLAASVFHFGTLRIGQVKDALRAAGRPVR